jgi:hypothetical protein
MCENKHSYNINLWYDPPAKVGQNFSFLYLCW